MEASLLTTRQQEIIYLLAQQVQTSQTLSVLLHVTSRTIRNDIHAINALYPNQIQASQNGYFLHPTSILRQIHREEDEAQKLLRQLLFASEAISLYTIEDTYFMSSSTLSNWIKKLNDKLLSAHLKIIRKQNTIFIEGSEFNKRKMISKMIYKEAEKTQYDPSVIQTYFDTIDITILREIILQHLQENTQLIDSILEYNLVINLAISLERIAHHYHVEIQHRFTLSSSQTALISSMCQSFREQFNLSIQKDDEYFIGLLVFGQMKSIADSEDIEVLKDTLYTLLDELFTSYYLDIDISSILDAFALHVHNLMIRSRIGNTTGNSLINSVKASCPFIYDLAVQISHKMEKTFSISINDHEIGFIAIHLGMSIEKSLATSNKIRTLLICPSYNKLQVELLQKLSLRFAETIYIEKISELPNEEEIQKNEFIISTLPFSTSQTSVLISPFLNIKDIKHIEQAIQEVHDKQCKEQYREILHACFHPTLFFKENFTDKKKAITFLCEQLIQHKIVSNTFTQNVLERERLSSTCFANTFALPHSIELEAKRTTIAVLINQHPIHWDDSDIRLVFLIAVNKNDRQNFISIYNGLADLLFDKQHLQAILQAQDYDDFMEILLQRIPS